MTYIKDENGWTIYNRTIFMRPAEEVYPDGTTFSVHLVDKTFATACGLTAGDEWRIESTRFVRDWFKRLCPGCRLLFLAELEQQLDDETPGQRPGAIITRVRWP